jgi:hypothetical protein
MEPKQFSYDSVFKMGYSGDYPYCFTCAMVSTCEPLFDGCGDNYEVEDLLKKNGVINRGCHCDSEGCQLFVNFKRKDTAHRFIDRLNKYLAKRAEQLGELKAAGF